MLHQSSRGSRLTNDIDDENKPSVEWLPSSGDEQENVDGVDDLHSLRDKEGRIIDTSEILNMTGVRDLKEMEKAREKL